MASDGYDPQQNELLTDHDKAYEPGYVYPHSNDILQGESSDMDAVDSPDDNQIKINSSPVNTHKFHNDFADREYRVEPDVSTPGYAPSQLADVESESPSYSDIGINLSPSVTGEPYKTPIDDAGLLSPSISLSPPVNSKIESADEASVCEPVEDNPVPSSFNLFDEHEDQLDQEEGNEDFDGFELDEQPESQVNGIIADIFGESDAEEEFEGFAENEVDKGVDEDVDHRDNHLVTSKQSDVDGDGSRQKQDSSSDDDDELVGEAFVSDFDLMMQRRREENSRRRQRNHDVQFINDAEDVIEDLVKRMRSAANEDRQLLEYSQPATKKLAMIKEVVSMLRRADLKTAVVEKGMLGAITEWLAPLPGQTLPNLLIRDELLKSLVDFESVETEVLKESGIGKALMYLTKHPLETRENKERATRLINFWLRPIFNLTCDYRTLSRDERKELDHERLPKRRNVSNETLDRRDINREMDAGSKAALRPGDPGWVGRARVPQPSTKDYIIRPKWNVSSSNESGPRVPRIEDDDDPSDDDGFPNHNIEMASVAPPSKSRKVKPTGALSRLETNIRTLAKNSRQSQFKVARAVNMSIGGRKMAL